MLPIDFLSIVGLVLLLLSIVGVTVTILCVANGLSFVFEFESKRKQFFLVILCGAWTTCLCTGFHLFVVWFIKIFPVPV